MEDMLLVTDNLTKVYKKTMAVNSVNIHIRKGAIYGLIGKNGAGKTTIMKMISGIITPTDGTFDYIGFNGDNREAFSRIGALIEAPALLPNLSAYDNLKLKCLAYGIGDDKYIKEKLELVGLGNVGKKTAGNFSLGMKQRLGIAIALLNTPEFLILDEPINGLDPAGIKEVRNLIKTLNKEYGMTILISSHILEELYNTATDFIFIDKGHIIEELSEAELNEKCKQHVEIRTMDPQKAIMVLEQKLNTDNFKLMPDNTIQLYDHLDDLETIAGAMAEEKVLVTGLTVTGDTLEEYFLNKIGGAS